jgi:hypothetical protein
MLALMILSHKWLQMFQPVLFHTISRLFLAITTLLKIMLNE